jgi:hypothetical protein
MTVDFEEAIELYINTYIIFYMLYCFLRTEMQIMKTRDALQGRRLPNLEIEE